MRNSFSVILVHACPFYDKSRALLFSTPRIPLQETFATFSFSVILKGEVVRVGSHACLCPGRWADTLARCCTSFVNSGPVHERTYLAKLDGSYEMGECYVTVSLGEEYEDCSYKFIAAVIECDRR